MEFWGSLIAGIFLGAVIATVYHIFKRNKKWKKTALVAALAFLASGFFTLENGPSEQSTLESGLPATILLKDKTVSAEDLRPYLEKYGQATMLLSDGVNKIVYNETLAQERMSPYSTFKIANALFALENGLVTRDNSLRKWDGIERTYVAEWNQDHDLASGMKYSCVWYYQEMAREIGPETMQKYLEQAGYGNQDISAGIDTFWLGSSLLITPAEQLDFIIKFYNNELPFQKENVAYVKTILKQDQYPLELFGKTGTPGWFVGYVLLAEKPYFFATFLAEGSGAEARDLTAKILLDFAKN